MFRQQQKSNLPDYPYADRSDLYTQWREPGTGKILNLPVGKNDPKHIAAEAKRKEEFGEWGQAKVYHFHNDQIGTPHELTAHSGELAWQADYQTWGNTVTCEWTQAHPPQIEQNIRFQGQYFDSETGLHYNRFRYYDPDCGRFVSHDPIGLLGGQNVYAYAVNPTGWVDPWGLAGNSYIPPPKTLPGFPNAVVAKRKTPVQGGGGLRKRWKLPGGCICEWDSQHGEIEKYDKRGNHLGAFDPNTGNRIPGKGAIATRTIKP